MFFCIENLVKSTVYKQPCKVGNQCRKKIIVEVNEKNKKIIVKKIVLINY